MRLFDRFSFLLISFLAVDDEIVTRAARDIGKRGFLSNDELPISSPSNASGCFYHDEPVIVERINRRSLIIGPLCQSKFSQPM